MVLTGVIVVLIVLFLKVRKVILIKLLESEGLAGEPVDRARNQFLLDILAKLVVELQPLFNIGGSLVVIIRRGLRRREEVEEGFGRDGLLDDAGLLGCWVL